MLHNGHDDGTRNFKGIRLVSEPSAEVFSSRVLPFDAVHLFYNYYYFFKDEFRTDGKDSKDWNLLHRNQTCQHLIKNVTMVTS